MLLLIEPTSALPRCVDCAPRHQEGVKRHESCLEPQTQPLLKRARMLPDVSEKVERDVVSANATYVVRSSIGRRRYQEDAWCVKLDFLRSSLDNGPAKGNLAVPGGMCSQGPLHLAAVCDGHGGPSVSQFCASMLPSVLACELQRLQYDAKQKLAQGPEQCSHHQQHQLGDIMVSKALQATFAALDAEVPIESSSEGGTTAVAAVWSSKRVWVANCGDSRAVLARGGQAVALTDDQKPERPDEAARIKQAGGHVFWNGGQRVMGVLSMTRAIGDAYLKRFGVTAEPEVTAVDRSPVDEFLLLASDGLWSVMSNQAAVDMVRVCMSRARAKGADAATAMRVATKVLIKAAINAGSHDNITVTIVDLTADQQQQQQQHPSDPSNSAAAGGAGAGCGSCGDASLSFNSSSGEDVLTLAALCAAAPPVQVLHGQLGAAAQAQEPQQERARAGAELGLELREGPGLDLFAAVAAAAVVAPKTAAPSLCTSIPNAHTADSTNSNGAAAGPPSAQHHHHHHHQIGAAVAVPAPMRACALPTTASHGRNGQGSFAVPPAAAAAATAGLAAGHAPAHEHRRSPASGGTQPPAAAATVPAALPAPVVSSLRSAERLMVAIEPASIKLV